MTTNHPAIAVIDGSLCRLSRKGTVVAAHAPLATAVLEFHHGPMRLYVREHPYGLLPGVPNLYCLDGDFRLQWLAEWPLAEDLCAKIVSVTDTVLTTESVAGVVVELNAANGRLLRCARPMAAAS